MIDDLFRWNFMSERSRMLVNLKFKVRI